MHPLTLNIGFETLRVMDAAQNPSLEFQREVVMLALCDYVSFFIGIDGVAARVLISDTITHGTPSKTWCVSK